LYWVGLEIGDNTAATLVQLVDGELKFTPIPLHEFYKFPTETE
jgi:hypothetical protein